MPETRFDDIIVIKPEGRNKIWEKIDSEYLYICEKESVKPVSYVPSSPCSCGITVKDNFLCVEIEGGDPKEIVIKLSGIRKGRRDKRFKEYSEEEASKNTRFWESWKIQ
jgi:hypothetical protein